jgi:ribA/ribD-fused uncharacterized protein
MYFKALLFVDIASSQKILKETNPRNQKALGRKIVGFSDEKWNRETSMAIVYVANYLKFLQNEKLYNYLMNDPGIEIVEASPYDRIWGIGLLEDNPKCLNKELWEGENRLGECIGQVKKFIKSPINNNVYHNKCMALVMALLDD